MDNLLTPPSSMRFDGNLAETWKRFKQRFNIYLDASRAGGNDVKKKASILLHVICEEALEIYNSFHISNGELKLDVIMTKFEEFFVLTTNVMFERHKFFSMIRNKESVLINIMQSCLHRQSHVNLAT